MCPLQPVVKDNFHSILKVVSFRARKSASALLSAPALLASAPLTGLHALGMDCEHGERLV